jgi:cell division protein FtsN
MRAYRKPEDRYELRIDSSRAALLGVGAGLVLLLVFLLGVLVGRGLWGGRRMAPIPLAEQPREETAPPEVAPEARPKLTFYEDLKKPDTRSSAASAPVAPEPVASAPALETEAAAPPPVPETAPATRPTSARAEVKPPPARTSKPEPRPTPTQKPTPKPKPKLPAPLFTVQVGSFRDRSAAEDQAREVAAHQRVPAQVVRASAAGRTWYRVQVGRFQTRSEAEAHYRNQLKPKGIQGFVTVR